MSPETRPEDGQAGDSCARPSNPQDRTLANIERMKEQLFKTGIVYDGMADLAYEFCSESAREVVLRVNRIPKHCLGVYADVVTPGRINLGDAVQPRG